MLRFSLFIFLLFNPLVNTFAQGQSEKPEISAILDQIHDALESDSEMDNKSFAQKMKSLNVKTWAQNFNLVQMYHKGYRLFHIYAADDQKREHVYNIIPLFALSHLSELMFAPVSSYLGHTFQWPLAVTSSLVTIGVIISYPFFLDPVCLLFSFSYKKFEKFRQFVTAVRKTSWNGIVFTMDFTRLNRFKKKFTQSSARQSLRDYFNDHLIEGPAKLLQAKDELFQNSEKLSIEWEIQENLVLKYLVNSEVQSDERVKGSNIEEIQIPIQAFKDSEIKKLVKDHFKNFHWNVRRAVEEILSLDFNKPIPHQLFYVENIFQENPNTLIFRFRKQSVPLKIGRKPLSSSFNSAYQKSCRFLKRN